MRHLLQQTLVGGQRQRAHAPDLLDPVQVAVAGRGTCLVQYPEGRSSPLQDLQDWLRWGQFAFVEGRPEQCAAVHPEEVGCHEKEKKEGEQPHPQASGGLTAGARSGAIESR